ncbi:MAG: molybdopterin-guanine dinucleotide biosynthesis protein B [Acidaminococcaceae bacterium]
MEEISCKRKDPYILSFVAACSDSGKTTLIEKLIALLQSKCYKIGVLKHSAHKTEIDQEGKDSFRFSMAGAEQVIVASKEKIGMIRVLQEELELMQILKLFSNVDIIIIEGYHNNEYPKIEVHRKSVCNRLLYESNDCGGIIAIASDEKLDANCEVLNINNEDCIAEWIADKAEKFFKTKSRC